MSWSIQDVVSNAVIQLVMAMLKIPYLYAFGFYWRNNLCYSYNVSYLLFFMLYLFVCLLLEYGEDVHVFVIMQSNINDVYIFVYEIFFVLLSKNINK